MADGDQTGDAGGFDEWLDEDAGPDTDPYASLADKDDAEAEIADWMAFTQGQDADEDAQESSAAEATAPPDSPSTDVGPIDEDAEEDLTVGDPAEQVSDDAPGSNADEQDPPAGEDDEPLGDEHDEPEEIDEPDASGYVDFDDEDDVTAEIPLAAGTDEPGEPSEPATSVHVGEFVGDGRADTDEIPMIAAADVVSASVVNETDETKQRGELDDPDALAQMPAVVVPTDDGGDVDDVDDSAADDAADEEPGDDTGELEAVEVSEPDDTGELEAVEDAAPGIAARVVPFADDDDGDDGDGDDGDGDDGDGSDADGPQFFDITREDYVQTATREHETLAAAIAEADTEDTEQVALAAPIPGLESTVVGFDDVVEAEGHRKARARGGGNLLARVITAIVLIAALGASLIWRPALLILATVAFVIGAGEFYTALTRTGRHPIALFGFAGIVAATVGAYFSGAIAITAAYVLILTVLLLYYAVVPGRRDPMSNLALTITVMVWVGLGSYAMLIAVSENWRPLVIGTVVLVAAMDIAQYFVGRAIGRHQLAPWVSPKKTIEGLVGGVVVALGLGALLHFVEPFELTSGLTLGAAVAVLAPLGDLAMSAAKRSLDLKDMGSILPGHGGFLDRLDGLLFVIPAAWAIFLWTGLL